MWLATLRTRSDVAVTALMAFALYGFLGNVMLDYNWGTNVVTNSFALIYSATLRRLPLFPIGWYGAGAAVYFGIFLLSFFILNRKTPASQNVLETVRMAAGTVVLFEVGLYLFVPYFMDYWVIDAVKNTALRSFTNTDLLLSALGLLAASQAVLSRMRHSGRSLSV